MYSNTTSNSKSNQTSDSGHVDTQTHATSSPRDSEPPTATLSSSTTTTITVSAFRHSTLGPLPSESLPSLAANRSPGDGSSETRPESHSKGNTLTNDSIHGPTNGTIDTNGHRVAPNDPSNIICNNSNDPRHLTNSDGESSNVTLTKGNQTRAWSTVPIPVTIASANPSLNTTVDSNAALNDPFKSISSVGDSVTSNSHSHSSSTAATTTTAAATTTNIRSHHEGGFALIAPSVQPFKSSVPNPLASSVPNPLASLVSEPLRDYKPSPPPPSTFSNLPQDSCLSSVASPSVGPTKSSSRSNVPGKSWIQAPNQMLQGRPYLYPYSEQRQNPMASSAQDHPVQSNVSNANISVQGKDPTMAPVKAHAAPQTTVGTVAAPTTTTTTTVPRRKLVLTAEGREALTKAVLSSLKHPRGVMDPTLLETAIRTTSLSREAILNAAKLAREKENQKRMALAAVAAAKMSGASSLQNRTHNVQQSGAQVPNSGQSRSQSQMPSGMQVQSYVHSKTQPPQSHMEISSKGAPIKEYSTSRMQPSASMPAQSAPQRQSYPQSLPSTQSQAQVQSQVQMREGVMSQNRAQSKAQPQLQSQVQGQPQMQVQEGAITQSRAQSRTQPQLQSQVQAGSMTPSHTQSKTQPQLQSQVQAGAMAQSHPQSRTQPQLQSQVQQAGFMSLSHRHPQSRTQSQVQSQLQIQAGSTPQSHPQSITQPQLQRNKLPPQLRLKEISQPLTTSRVQPQPKTQVATESQSHTFPHSGKQMVMQPRTQIQKSMQHGSKTQPQVQVRPLAQSPHLQVASQSQMMQQHGPHAHVHTPSMSQTHPQMKFHSGSKPQTSAKPETFVRMQPGSEQKSHMQMQPGLQQKPNVVHTTKQMPMQPCTQGNYQVLARPQSQHQKRMPSEVHLNVPVQPGNQSYTQSTAQPFSSKPGSMASIPTQSMPQPKLRLHGQPPSHQLPQTSQPPQQIRTQLGPLMQLQAQAKASPQVHKNITIPGPTPAGMIQNTPQAAMRAATGSQPYHAQNSSDMHNELATSSSSLKPTSSQPLQPHPQEVSQKTKKKPTSPSKFEMQMKAAKEAAITFHQEMSRWKRIQHGIFLNGNDANQQQGPLKTCSLGALSRSIDVQPVLKYPSFSKTINEELRKKIIALQSEAKAAGLIDGIAPKQCLPDHSPVIVTESNCFHRFSNTKVTLSDVTEKQKRVKLQSRKESKALERNLRKHRHVVCEVILKKNKELNKSILQHATDFYKFHRQRKSELSKFSKSVRDHVAAEMRKREKDSVNEEKARIAALKANDMEAYSALVQETRNDRLKFLLDKTDQYIDQISVLLKDQHQESNMASESRFDSCGVELVGGSRLLPAEHSDSNYYKTAHVYKEDVKQPSILVGGSLKEYQLSGLQWLVSLYNNKLNGILADEMGLGKTVQTIALISYLMEFKDNRGPYLVIVPLSTLSNWVNEFRRWCPTATVIVYKGTPAQRKGLYKSEVMQGHFNVLLTTYEYIIKDKSSLRKLHWEYAIVDEGHRMKNSQSKFAVTLGTQYITKHRVLLTGTPLQNNLPELWSLLNFLLPSIFNSAETFDQWFNKPFAQFGTPMNDGETEETVNNEERLLIIQRLHELLRPFMLRRIKADVLDQLPDKVEKVLRCELSSWQKELYKQISYSVLEDGQKKSKRGLNNVVMQLRKVCNHPYMFTPEGYYITEDIIRSSGKFELLDRMLPKLKAARHRILMFFQMTAAMTIMEDYLKYRNILSLRLDGSTTGEERERRMDLFNSPNSPYFIFMLSTRAGGLGLNLVSADTVIIFDSDWNPMMDLQAQDRAHRIGQKKIVSVFRLITNSPVEEKILSRATEKLNMSELVVEAGKFDRDSVEDVTAEERQKIMEILLTDFDTTAAKGSATGATSSLPTDEDDGKGNGDNDEKEEIDINELLSRNDEDYEFYTKMDSGENIVEDYFKSPGLATDPDDIPDWIKYPHGKQAELDNGDFHEDRKRRAAANAAAYDDGLTEKQFLRIMEKQADAEEEEAKARKREWKLARDKKTIASAAMSLSTSSITDDIQNRLVTMTRSIIALRDPKTNRRFSDIFREKPSADDYPEYYEIIEEPISINDILKKCRCKGYSSAAEYHHDWKLMFSNAAKFNGEDSWVVLDGKVLEVELNRLLKKYELLEEPKPTSPSPTKKKKPRLKLSLKLSKKRKSESDAPSTDSKRIKMN